jgi:methionine--tRNA ligase beta chain
MNVSFEDFKKLDLRIGLIVGADPVEGSDKLVKLRVDTGEGERQILAGIAQYYGVEDLVGKRIVVVANLEPKTMMGLESQGMLLAADTEEGPVLLMPDHEVPPGSKIR